MSDKQRFSKLIGTMGEKKKMANPVIDDNLKKRLDSQDELARIDEKIHSLQETGDKESLEFWKKRRAQLAGE